MAQFDVYSSAGQDALILDCQADLLSHLNTRFVVPLLSHDQGPKPARILNPTLVVSGNTLVMYTQFAATVPLRDLGEPIASLAGDRAMIMNALDMLLTGY